jgi:hypothetical protein
MSLPTRDHENRWRRRRQDARAAGLDGHWAVSQDSEKILSQPEPGAVSYFPEQAGRLPVLLKIFTAARINHACGTWT